MPGASANVHVQYRQRTEYLSLIKYVGVCIIIFQLQLKVNLLSESSTVTHKSLTNRNICIYTNYALVFSHSKLSTFDIFFDCVNIMGILTVAFQSNSFSILIFW